MPKTKSAQKTTEKKTRPLYTTGQINKIIDSTIEPLSRIHPVFIGIDELLHALNEGNPSESFRKFVKYSLPKVIAEILKDRD
jgi:hypothetical protein